MILLYQGTKWLSEFQDMVLDPDIKIVPVFDFSQALSVCQNGDGAVLIIEWDGDVERVRRQVRMLNSLLSIYICVFYGESIDTSFEEALWEMGVNEVFGGKSKFLKYRIKNLKKILVSGEMNQVEARVGNLRLDLVNRVAAINDRIISLSGREFNLLKILIENKGSIVKSDALKTSVWSEVSVSTSNIHTQLYNLKKKMKDFSGEIVTIHKVGVKLNPEKKE